MNDDASSMSGAPPGSCAAVEEALGAYALGVLDASERPAIEAHLVACPACRAGLGRYEEVVGTLGAAVRPVAPPPALRAALLDAAGTAQPGRGFSWRTVDNQFLPRVAIIGLAIAASLLVVAVATMGALLVRADNARDEARYGQGEIAEYLHAGATLVPLAAAPGAPADAGPGLGTLAVAPDQPGAMMIVHGLAATGDGRRYVAWAARGGERVALGELQVGEDGSGWIYLQGPEPMTSYDRVILTRLTDEAPNGEDFLIAPIPAAPVTG